MANGNDTGMFIKSSNLRVASGIIGILVVSGGIFGTWSRTSYRVEQNEKMINRNVASINKMESHRVITIELLGRIDERLKRLEDILNRRPIVP